MAIAPQDVRLLANPPFRRLLEARFLGQAAQNAMLYALLILVVEESGSSIGSTLLMVALVAPAVVFSVPAGAAADLLPKRFSLAFGYLARGAIAAGLVYYSSDLPAIYLLAAASSIVNQLFVPAEAATVPGIVRREQLGAANSIMVFVLIMAQVAGLVVMAPILLKLVSADAVFIACAGLSLAAAFLILLARGLTTPPLAEVRPPGMIEAMREAFRILRSDRHAYLAVVYVTIGITLARVLFVLLPEYTEGVLRIEPEDTVFVAAPAAIGAGLGLIISPPLARFIGGWRVVVAAFVLLLLGLAGLGLVVYIRDFLETHTRLEPGINFVEEEVGVSSVITATMLLAIPIGLAFTALSVASRIVINEQAPQQAQGRIFAVQGALADLLSLLPLLVIGVLSELAGVRATLLAASAAGAAGAAYITFTRRPALSPPASATGPA